MTLAASDLDRLVRSCSALQTLSLRCSRGLQVTGLLHLTALTQLWLTGVQQSSTVASLAQLSQLQGLQRLAITDPCSLPDDEDDALLPLTALTQLTYMALTDKEGAFSPAMQQQLCHLCKEPFEECGPCCIIRNTVSALIWSGCSRHACLLHCEQLCMPATCTNGTTMPKWQHMK